MRTLETEMDLITKKNEVDEILKILPVVSEKKIDDEKVFLYDLKPTYIYIWK